MEVMLPSALLPASGERRTQDTLPAWGWLAAARERRHDLFLKGNATREEKLGVKVQAAFCLKNSVMQSYLLLLSPPVFKADPYLFSDDAF